MWTIGPRARDDHRANDGNQRRVAGNQSFQPPDPLDERVSKRDAIHERQDDGDREGADGIARSQHDVADAELNAAEQAHPSSDAGAQRDGDQEQLDARGDRATVPVFCHRFLLWR